MKVPKPSDADVEFFRSIVPDDVAIAVKPMFGNLAAFVNDNMFMGLFGSNIGLRLPAGERDELLGTKGGSTFGPPERPMREYAVMPTAWRDEPDLTEAWVARAIAHTGAMPPKKKRAPKKKA